jgi:hypothetical protein
MTVEAERKALAERMRLHPMQIELRRMAGNAEASGETVEAALNQWVKGFKNQTGSTSKSYKYFVLKVSGRAECEGIKRVAEITADHLNTRTR